MLRYVSPRRLDGKENCLTHLKIRIRMMLNFNKEEKYNDAQCLAEIAKDIIKMIQYNKLTRTEIKRMGGHCLLLLDMADRLTDEIVHYDTSRLN